MYLCQGKVLRGCTKFMGYTRQKIHSQCIRADSRIRLQWCQEIRVHECAKIASTKTTEVD